MKYRTRTNYTAADKGVIVHDDARQMCVFDGNGEPYSISREKGVCYLTNHEDNMLVHNRRFEIVLQALQILLTTKPNRSD